MRNVTLQVVVEVDGHADPLVLSAHLDEGFDDREFKLEGEELLDIAREELLRNSIAEHHVLRQYLNEWLQRIEELAVAEFGMTLEGAQFYTTAHLYNLELFFVAGHTPREALNRYYTEPPQR